VATNIQNKFGVLTSQKVLLSEKVTSGCAYTFVLSLGRADDAKTKLEKIYLTNDTADHRTSLSMDQTKDSKFSVKLIVYLTADGKSDLGVSDDIFNGSLPSPPSDPVPIPLPNPTPTPTPNPPTPPPGPTGDATCYKGDAKICRIEKLIADKTNSYRRSRGLSDLEYDAKVAFLSRDWSRQQAQSGSISHNGFPSARQGVYRNEFGVNLFLTAENVAYNYCGSRDEEGAASAFIDQWWNSAGHRANMLGGHRGIGVGVFIDSSGRCYGTQIFR
jgi:uncharacterized protein YkwD